MQTHGAMNDKELERASRLDPDGSKLDEAYERMAADEVREAGADEWSEALIADVADAPSPKVTRFPSPLPSPGARRR
jgi:hypothetical protein